MRKELIAAASVLALTAGGAFAQTGSGTTDPEAAMPPAASSGATLTSAEQMMGKTVVGSDGQEIGEVEDVILDAQQGQAEQLVISSGGFLGIGERQIAIDFASAQLDPANGQVKISNLTREGVRDLPEFSYDDTVMSLGRRNNNTGGSMNNDGGAMSPGMSGSGDSGVIAPAPGGTGGDTGGSTGGGTR
jgi:sporulation protein YlmC with PRC-barrel domain